MFMCMYLMSMFSSVNSSATSGYMLSRTTLNLLSIYPTTKWAWSFANEQNQKIIQTVISSLSLFGSLTIIFTYFLFQDLQTITRKLLVYISIGDFFTVFPYLIVVWVKHNSTSLNCQVQSFVTTTAVMWSFFWTSTLAIYLYLVIVKKNQEKADKLMPYFHVINWGLPLALVAAAWGNNMLGNADAENSGGWCWITYKSGTNNDAAIWWMLACGKFWEILSYFVDVIVCFIVTKKINAEVEELQNNLLVSSQSVQVAIQGKRKLLWAPCLFVLLRMWGTIRFLLLCFNSHKKNWLYEALIILHIIGDSSQGFVYFILFCLYTAMFRENIAKLLCTCCKRQSRITVREGRPNSSQGRNAEHKYLLQNPKTIVFYT